MSSYYRHLIQYSSYAYLIDLFSSITMAFDFRKLRSTYSGNAIRVLRTSDNTEQDFPFVANEVVGADVLSFAGAFGSLSKGYNQVSGADDVINATIIRQPIIVNGGTLIADGGKLALQGGATLGLRSTSVIALSGYSDLFITFGVNVTNTVTTQILLESSTNFNSNNGAFTAFISGGLLVVSQRISVGVFTSKSYPISTGRQLITVRFRTVQTAINASQVWINGVEITGTVVLNNSSIALSNQILYLFSRNANTVGFLGRYANFTMFTNSGQRVGIENNINDYYGYY